MSDYFQQMQKQCVPMSKQVKGCAANNRTLKIFIDGYNDGVELIVDVYHVLVLAIISKK